MSKGLIDKRVRIVFDDDGLQTRTGIVTCFTDSYVFYISDRTGREEGINHKLIRKVEAISERREME